MNNIKKILSMVLCLAMLLSMNASAFATEGTEETATGDCGHNNFSVETTEATCDTAGLNTFKCQTEGCDYSYTETVEATGHNYVDGVCSACGTSENGGEEEPSTDVGCDCSVKCVEGNVDTVCTVCAADYTACIAAPISALTDGCTVSNNCTLDAGHAGLCSDGTTYLNGTAVAKIGTSGFASLDDALTTANSMTGEVTITIIGATEYTGNVKFNGSYTNLSFVGADKSTSKISIPNTIGYIDGSTSAQISFSNLTLCKPDGKWLNNAAHMAGYFTVYCGSSVTYSNCDFPQGSAAQGRPTSYSGCSFTNGNKHNECKYSLWVYANTTVTADNCVFNGRGIKMYAENNATPGNLILKNSNLSNATEKPAVVLTKGSSVTFENNTYCAEKGMLELDKDGTPNGTPVTSDVAPTCINDDFPDGCGVLVDGKIYITVAQAAEAAEYGSTVTLLHASTETVEFPVGVTLNDNGFNAPGVTVKDPVVKIGEKGYGSLQEAVDAAVDGDEIVFQTDITGNVTVTQKENVKFTINGNGKTMKGSITVDGKSARYETAGVTIKNINFAGTSVLNDAFIGLGISENDNTRYTNNVTVDSCTFDGSGIVGVKSYTGGDLNLTITNCTANAGTHSLAQLKNIEKNLVISNNKIYSKNGINLNNTLDATITGNTVDVTGYAVRIGESGATNKGIEKLVIENNTLKSACADGDAVIMVRGTALNADIDIEKNAVSGTTHISGNTTDTDITADANYWDGKKAPVVPANGTEVSVVSYYEDEKLTQLAQGGGAVAENNGQYYSDLQDAVDTATAGDEIVVLKEHAPTAPIVVEKNLTIDFANKEMACADIYPVIRVQGGATLTVKNGNITNNDYVFVLGASDSSSAGNLNIESGTYHGTTTVVSVTKGNLHISGGSFSVDPYYAEGSTEANYDFLLNCYDPNRADCKITVKGGSFANFDPANNAAEGANTNFVADNYTSVADGSNYTVKPLVTVSFNDAEMIRGNAQPSYTYSSNASVHGYTVEVTPASITVNDNTSTYDITAATVVVKNGSTDVTANCKVEVTPGTLTVKTAAVKLTSGSTDTYYKTLADAAAAAKDGDTVTLLADSAEDLAVADNITLALSGNNYTGTADVAEGKQLSMSLADLKTLTDGLKVKGEVKIGDTEIAMVEGTVKADASGNITATPTADSSDGFVAVEVNKVAVLLESGSVTVDANGTASFSGYALVLLADGSVAVLEKGGSVDKTGAITTTPAEVTDKDGKGVGYGAVTVISKDGKTQTGYLVPAGESLTLKLNSKNVLEPSTAKDVEDPIVDAGADFKDYLSVDPVKKSFYNKSYVSMTFTCNGFIDGLEKLEVTSSANNYSKVLTSNECSVTQGSTVVKLKNSYLRNLALGTYTLTYTYADGQTAEATFYVVNTPLTGDYNNLAPFAAAMGFSILALAIVLVLLKKRRA